jgi:hypothetical protein
MDRLRHAFHFGAGTFGQFDHDVASWRDGIAANAARTKKFGERITIVFVFSRRALRAAETEWAIKLYSRNCARSRRPIRVHLYWARQAGIGSIRARVLSAPPSAHWSCCSSGTGLWSTMLSVIWARRATPARDRKAAGRSEPDAHECSNNTMPRAVVSAIDHH